VVQLVLTPNRSGFWPGFRGQNVSGVAARFRLPSAPF
jgi:hypothetical protein